MLRADVDRVFDLIKKRDWTQIEARPVFRDILTKLLVQAGVSDLQKKVLQAGKGGRVTEVTVTNYSATIDRLAEYAEQNRRALLKLRK